MIEEVKKIINNKIEEIESSKQSIVVLSKEEIDGLKSVVDLLPTTKEGSGSLLELSEENILKLEAFCTKEEIRNLLAMRVFLENPLFDFQTNLSKLLIDICNGIKYKFNSYTNSLEMLPQKQEDDDRKLKALKEISEKLESSIEQITSKDIEFLISILNDAKFGEVNIMNAIIEITATKLNKLSGKEEAEELLEVVETNLVEEDVKNLFEKYRYDFYSLKVADRADILKYGVLENIESILKSFIEYSFDLNKDFLGKPLISKRSTQLSKIFIHSNSNNIVKLFNFCKDNDIELYDLLEYPSRFISRKHKYKSRTNSSDNDVNISKVGCLEDFIKNYDMFKAKYFKISTKEDKVEEFKRIYSKCPSIFNLANEKILTILKIYTIYGINPEDYFNALASFSKARSEEIFDLAIELGAFEYIKHNMSKVILSIDDEFFKKLAIANKMGISAFKYENRQLLTGGVRPSLCFETTKINKMISSNGLKFQKYELNNHFTDEELKLFNMFEKMISSDTEFSEDYLTESNINSGIIKGLEKYIDEEDSRVYNINGIKISKLKVLRLHHTLKLNGIEDSVYSVIYILTKNSLITDDEFLNLFGVVSTLIKDIPKEKKK